MTLFPIFKIQAVSKHDPLKYIQQTPSLTGKLARWLILLTEFDIEYLSRKVIKGRAVVDFLAQNPMEDSQEWELEFVYCLFCYVLGSKFMLFYINL